MALSAPLFSVRDGRLQRNERRRGVFASGYLTIFSPSADAYTPMNKWPKRISVAHRQSRHPAEVVAPQPPLELEGLVLVQRQELLHHRQAVAAVVHADAGRGEGPGRAPRVTAQASRTGSAVRLPPRPGTASVLPSGPRRTAAWPGARGPGSSCRLAVLPCPPNPARRPPRPARQTDYMTALYSIGPTKHTRHTVLVPSAFILSPRHSANNGNSTSILTCCRLHNTIYNTL